MKIEKLGGDIFKVIISGPTKTEHKVTVTDNYHKRLSDGRMKKEELLEFLFKFLLQRMPNTSILSSFDGTDSDELTIEQIVHRPPEYSQWESRN